MDLAKANNDRWLKVSINPNKLNAFANAARRLTDPTAVARYKSVEAKTGVPWWFIAVVHEREASQKWNTQLGQGDPLNRKSIHVPKGRGPFNTWEEGAIDALVNCAPYAARQKDWSIGAALAMLEKYNGLGYANKGRPSPYIWAGTNQYVSGKYVADGKYDPNAVDTQLGCAGLLKAMKVFDGQIGAEHGAAGGAVVAGAAAASQYPHLAIYIIAGAVVIAIGAFILIKYLRKGK
jgi:lysozyme family protein